MNIQFKKRDVLRIMGATASAVVLSTALVACGGDDDDDAPLVATGTLAQTVESRGYTALLAAAVKAELADELAAANANLTVFAPTNAAFTTLATQLGFADAAALVAALDQPTLAKILSYHLLPTSKGSTALGASEATAYTFEEAPTALRIATTGGVRITDGALAQASVTQANVPATNGTLHGVDKVLIPPGVLNVVQMASVNPTTFSSLVAAVTSAELATTLSGPGPFTVFAPTNAAFSALTSPPTGAALANVLTYHVVPSQVLSSAIPFGQPVTMVGGGTITLAQGTAPTIATITDGAGSTPPANVTAVDVRASNGVIHVIDKVLLPASAPN
jgi:uncharacterized surface protein with fasciclin (FAS1) repeats